MLSTLTGNYFKKNMGLDQITEPFLAKSAGWEAMKSARQYLKSGAVLAAEWKASRASGLIQAGSLQYQAGLVFESEFDIENLCTCRESRQYGSLCAHSVAIALATLYPDAIRAEAPPSPRQESVPSMNAGKEKEQKPAPWFNYDPTSKINLSLRFILAPNSTRQMQPQTVAVMLEGSTDGSYKPLNTFPRNQAYHFTESDRHLLKLLEDQADGKPVPMIQMKTAAFCDFLNLLQGSDQLMLGRSEHVKVSNQVWIPHMEIKLTDDGSLSITCAGTSMPQGLFMGQPGYVWVDKHFQPMGLPSALMPAFQSPMTVPRIQVPFILHQLDLLPDSDRIHTDFSLNDFKIDSEEPRIQLFMEGGLARLDARLKTAYGDQVFPVSLQTSPTDFCTPDPSDHMRYILRNPGAEQSALDELKRAGFISDAKGECWRLTGQDAVLSFIAGPYQRLQKDWKVILEERLDWSFQRNIETVQPEVRVHASSGDWFDFKVDYHTSGGGALPQDEIQRLLRSGKSYRKNTNGKFLMLDTEALQEFNEVLVDCNPQQHHGEYRVRKSHSTYLEQTIQENRWNLRQEGFRPDSSPDSEKKLLQSIHQTMPDLANVLRPYQWHGVIWMHQMFERGFAGILADEMGLGKTLQVLTWMQWRLQRQPKIINDGDNKHAPFLVICPSSLVFNWAEEAKRWTPKLRVLTLEGSQRAKRYSQIPDHDLVITSYALIRRDLDVYQKVTFEALILDEAQHIKNRATQNAQSVKAIRAHHRLVLTGTPMENSVLDLWSIFDFLMPGYLGSARDFKERYEIPVSQQSAQPVLSRLKRRVGPFLLRRTKKEVRPDLPDRIDQVAYCELTPEQRTLYQQIMEGGRAKLLEIAGEKQPSGQARMMVLSAILRMRQICCDARLLDLDPDKLKHPSSKLELFSELLDEAIDGGHRVLVFSQFVKMLTILRERLEENGVEYCYLDGSTAKRGQVVQRFQNSTIPVFLISLKAGGTGLNLTGADTVIHFDPWWNPAVEAQATARAHRIGQTQTVTSYKLIARDTIEEKILHLQQRKQAQLDSMLATGNIENMESLNWEDIESLFE
jgi:SNF2 family DNA or RNA helicase